jgi:hypothetical protein
MTRNGATRSCVGKGELSMFAVVLFLYGQQPQQYLESNLVARRITFGNRYEFTVPHDADVFVLSGALHCDLQGSCANQIVTGCDHFTWSVSLTPCGLFSIREAREDYRFGTV